MLKKLKRWSSKESEVESVFGDVIADCLCRYHLLKNNHVSASSEYVTFDPSILDRLLDKNAYTQTKHLKHDYQDLRKDLRHGASGHKIGHNFIKDKNYRDQKNEAAFNVLRFGGEQMQSNSELHERFARLYENGKLELKSIPQLYSVNDKKFVSDYKQKSVPQLSAWASFRVDLADAQNVTIPVNGVGSKIWSLSNLKKLALDPKAELSLVKNSSGQHFISFGDLSHIIGQTTFVRSVSPKEFKNRKITAPPSLRLDEVKVMLREGGIFEPIQSGEIIDPAGTTYETNALYPNEYYKDLSEMIVADLGENLLSVQRSDAVVNVDHLGRELFHRYKNSIVIPLDQDREKLHREIDENVKFLNRHEVAQLHEKLDSLEHFNVSTDSNFGLLIPVMMRHNKMYFNRQMLDYFNKNLPPYARFPDFHSSKSVLESMFRGGEGAEYDGIFKYSSEFINAYVELEKLEKPKKLSLEEEFMSMSPRRRGGGATSSTPYKPADFDTKSCFILPHDGLDKVLSSAIVSHAIGDKVPKCQYYFTPTLKAEWDKHQDITEIEKSKKDRSVNVEDMMSWQLAQGLDGFRLLMINGMENGEIKMTTKKQREASTKLYVSLRQKMNHIQQRIVGFNPSEMAPGQLTTLDSMLLGYVHDQGKRIDEAYQKADLKEALVLTQDLIDQFGGDILTSLIPRLVAGSPFDRYSARTVLYIVYYQIQQSLLVLTPVLGESLHQVMSLFEKAEYDEIKMLSQE